MPVLERRGCRDAAVGWGRAAAVEAEEAEAAGLAGVGAGLGILDTEDMFKDVLLLSRPPVAAVSGRLPAAEAGRTALPRPEALLGLPRALKGCLLAGGLLLAINEPLRSPTTLDVPDFIAGSGSAGQVKQEDEPKFEICQRSVTIIQNLTSYTVTDG